MLQQSSDVTDLDKTRNLKCLSRSAGAARALGPSRSCCRCPRWLVTILLRWLRGVEVAWRVALACACLCSGRTNGGAFQRAAAQMVSTLTTKDLQCRPAASGRSQPAINAAAVCIYSLTWMCIYIEIDLYILLIMEIAMQYEDETQSYWHNFLTECESIEEKLWKHFSCTCQNDAFKWFINNYNILALN